MSGLPHILIVDDDPAIRETLRFFFEDAGYTVADAGDVATAETILLANSTPQVVLLDYIMPQTSGFALLQRAAADTSLRERAVFILITASSKYAELEQEITQFPLAVTLVRKPFDLDHLASQVRDAAERIQSNGQ
jgi:two-component system phosphate regulon response regulator PhoB